MERKYELVAWTRNVSDNENARLYILPSLECEVQATLISDLTFIHREEYKGPVSVDLARKAIAAYERMSRFEILTGHYGDGIRYLFFAANYCISECTCHDADGIIHSSIREELEHEFISLCDKALSLAKKHNREDILLEWKPERALLMTTHGHLTSDK